MISLTNKQRKRMMELAKYELIFYVKNSIRIACK